MLKDKQKKDEQKKDEVIEAAASGKVSRKEFEKELTKLQVELTRLQTWVKEKGARVIVVFEGRDTAGKGGVISRITARTTRASTATWHCPSHPTARRHKFSFSATSRISRRRARSSSSTARGTTGPGSSG